MFAYPTFAVESLVATVKEFRRRGDEIDAGLIDALNRHIAASGERLHVWAGRFSVRFDVFVKTLAGEIPVSGCFWDQVRRVFEPLRSVQVPDAPTA